MATNGQLVFTDVDKVTFKGVGNTSNAVIDTTTGKIGVGVDSPDANLHVLGNCFVSTNFELGGTMTMGTVTVRAQHELSAITATGNTTPHTIEFQNATTGFVTTGNVSVGKELTVSGNVEVGTANLFVDTVNSRVGIGTTNPQDITHIWKDGANDAHGLLIEQNNAGTGSATLRFGVAHAGESTAGLSKAGIFFKRAASNGRGDLLFCMDNANDTNDVDTSNHALTIYRNGNVGIGTSIPSSIFNTYGGALWDGSSMSSKVCATLQVGRGGGTGSAANDTGFGGILEFRHHSDSRFVTIESVSEAAYSASIGLSFKTHGGTGDGERMRIAGNGNVGIGTTSPLGTLHVQTETRSGTEGSGTGIYVTSGSSGSSNGSEFRHSNQSQGTGIGYAGIYATGSNADQDLSIVSRGTGNTYVKNYQVYSDDRIKTNEEYITNATETLMKLKPQVYDKHEEINVISDNPKREAGLIAQDIYYDAPELRYIVSTRNEGIDAEPVDIPPEKPFVDEDPTRDPDYSSWGTASAGVAYIQLVPYLIKSIQELQERIKVLENA